MPSISATLSRTRSTSEVGRFLPTKSARIGSSRWPRSTSTASRTAAGRPTSFSASSAERMVRPLNSTSSTSTTTLPSTPPGGISVGSSARAGLSRRSSRYMVASSDPTGTSYPSTAAIRSAIRWARGTPRVGMPSRTRSPAPLLRSRISWEMRVSARAMSRSSRTVRPPAAGDASCRAGLGWAPISAQTSLSASLDGPLKDVGRRRPYRSPAPSAPATPPSGGIVRDDLVWRAGFGRPEASRTIPTSGTAGAPGRRSRGARCRRRPGAPCR